MKMSLLNRNLTNLRCIILSVTVCIAVFTVFILFQSKHQAQATGKMQNSPDSIATVRPEIRWMRGGHTFSQAIDHAWDGDTMATMSIGEVKLWRTSDNTLLRTIPKTSTSGVNKLSLNSNGQYLAFTDGNLTVRVYNVVSGALVGTFVITDQTRIEDIDLSPNGGDLAISFNNGGDSTTKLRVYRIDTGDIVADKPYGEVGGDIEYSWDNFISNYYLAAVASCPCSPGQVNDVRLYNPDSSPNRYNFVRAIPNLGFKSLAFSKEGTYLAASSGLGIRVINTSGNPTTLTTLVSGATLSPSIAFSPNNLNLVVTGTARPDMPGSSPDGGNILSFPIPAVGFSWTTTPLAQWNAESLGSSPLYVAYSNTSKLAVWGKQHVRFWDTGIGQPCGPSPQPCGEYQSPFTDSYRVISTVAYSPDGTMVAAGHEGNSVGEGNKISVWNAVNGARIKTLDYGASSTSVRSIAFTSDNQNIIVSGTSGTKLIHISDGTVLNSSGETGEFVISPNRQMIAIGSNTGSASIVVLRNTNNLAAIRTIFTSGSGSGANATPLAFTMDNSRVAALEFNSALQLFNVNTGNPVFTFGGASIGNDRGRGAFTPNGQYFIGGGQNNVLSVWNAANGSFIRSLPGYTGNITGVNITPEGQYLFTASRDAKIRVWRIAAPNPADWVLINTYDEETGADVTGGQIDSATFSPDGSRYFYGRRDATVVMIINPYDIRTSRFDFDGDGKADVSVFRPSNGAWYLLQSQAGFTGVSFGISTDKIVPADYDGDGKTDVAVYRSGTWYLQRSTTGFTGVSFGAADDIPIPADYDGDGKAEIAVFRPSNGGWYLYNLATSQTNSFAFGQTGDIPVAADYDGDNKADIAVFRSGTWYIQRSQLGFTGIGFGTATDKPVPADYDGDGKADVAVFRNGTWYLLQSTTGFTGITFGISTDLPTPADYDGDGKSDVAVFRDGTWYLQRSQAGFTGIAFGTSGDKPIPNAYIP